MRRGGGFGDSNLSHLLIRLLNSWLWVHHFSTGFVIVAHMELDIRNFGGGGGGGEFLKNLMLFKGFQAKAVSLVKDTPHMS